MSASSYQLPLEQTLKAFLVSQAILPASFPIHCAHAAEQIESEADYLSIIAGKPRGDLAYSGNPEIAVEFWLVHSVADEAARPARAQLHADQAAALINLFDFDNTPATCAALRLAGVPLGLGFTGWESSDENSSDGTTEKGQIVNKLGYIFDVYLL